jgi:hypothetical protein
VVFVTEFESAGQYPGGTVETCPDSIRPVSWR